MAGRSWGSAFCRGSSEPVGSGAAAATNLEPGWWRLVMIWCFWSLLLKYAEFNCF